MKIFWLFTLISLSHFVHAAPPLEVALYKNAALKKETISVRIKNTTDQPVHFKYLSLQQRINNQWALIIYDITCPCLAKCNIAPTTVAPKKNLHLVFDFNALGCGTLAHGVQYRATAEGDWNKENNARTMFGQSEPFIPIE